MGVNAASGSVTVSSSTWSIGQPDSGSLDRYIGHGTRDNGHFTVMEGDFFFTVKCPLSLVPCPMYLSNDPLSG